MPRPSIHTSTLRIVRVLRGLPAWQTRHAAALADELADHAVSAADPGALATDLEDAERVLLQERKDDKNIYTRRATFLSATQSWIRAIRAALTRRLAQHEAVDRILADFGFSRPSDITSTDDANTALTRIGVALTAHTPTLTPLTSLLPAWHQRLAELQTERRALDDDLTRETRETAEAHALRDAFRARAVALIRDLDLAARAIERDTAPHDALRALYDAP